MKNMLISNVPFFFYTIGPLVEQTMDDIKQIFDTNTFAVLRVCKAVVPNMAKRRSGTIVNIGSIVGEMYEVVFFFFFFAIIYMDTKTSSARLHGMACTALRRLLLPV